MLSNDPELERLLSRGPQDADYLKTALGISQPVLSRRLSTQNQNGRLIKIGKARATRYALLRVVDGLAPREAIPLYEVDEKGTPHERGDIYPIAPEGCGVQASDSFFLPKSALTDHIPFYLEDMRPEGFLERQLISFTSKQLHIPGNARDWTGNHLLLFLSQESSDLKGSLILGKKSLEMFLLQQIKPDNMGDIELYEKLASQVTQGRHLSGSSAGGEQPKFTTCLSREGEIFHVIVKFSPPTQSIAAKRWKDLLIAEYHALNTLREAGLQASPVELLQTPEQAFLQVERFDRVGKKGRRPYISFGAIDDEFLGMRMNHRDSLLHLHKMKLLPLEDLQAGITASLFGDLIGNTDQHFGNLSFTYRDKFYLAPFYDILPMWYAPRNEVLPDSLHKLPVRMPEHGTQFDQARELALIFWEKLRNEKSLSNNFKGIASENQNRIRDIPD